MSLTTRGRYGLRALIELAAAGDRPLQLKRIAKRQGISRKYLEQLLVPLRDAGIVRTARGPGGGYTLAVCREELTASRILSILEGPNDLAPCLVHGQSCDRAGRCVTKELWEKVDAAIDAVLGGITLADLTARQAELGLDDRDSPTPVCGPEV